jgi:hypothetical protein
MRWWSAFRGFRPRSENRPILLMSVVMGVVTGVYIFDEPLKEATRDHSPQVPAGKK